MLAFPTVRLCLALTLLGACERGSAPAMRGSVPRPAESSVAAAPSPSGASADASPALAASITAGDAAPAPGEPTHAKPARVRKATLVPKLVRFPRSRFGEKLPAGQIRYPSVKLPKEPAVERAINGELGLVGFPKNLFDKYQDWLDEIDFHVNTNDDGILDLTLSISGSGAYPSSSAEHYAFDLDTGRRLSAKDLFDPARMDELAKRLDAELQKELEEARAGRIKNLPADCPKDMLEGTFAKDQLEHFTLGDRGVTFDYPYDFPHAFLACQPPGSFEISYAELAPFVAKDGPLARKLP